MTGRRLLALAAAAAALAACGRRATPAERRRVICMQKSVELGERPPTSTSLAQLRDACATAFGHRFQPPRLGSSHPANPFHRWRHFIGEGDLACSDQVAARVQPLQWQALLAACGRDHFGLPAGLEPFFSESWYVGQRVGAWLARERAASAGDPSWAAFYQRAGQGSFALEYPLAAPGLYTLPGSATSSVDPGALWPHVLVLADRLLVGGGPRLRLVPDGVAPLVERFPGEPAAAVELGARLAGAARPHLIASRELPAARLFEVAAAAPAVDFGLLVAAQGLRAVVHRAPLSALGAARRAELASGTVDDVARALDALERERAGGPPASTAKPPPAPPVRPIR